MLAVWEFIRTTRIELRARQMIINALSIRGKLGLGRLFFSDTASGDKVINARQHPSTDVRFLVVIAPNIARRLSGVSATLERVVPIQVKHISIAVFGSKPTNSRLAKETPHIGFADLLKLRSRPPWGGYRIWHARRNIEMLCGVLLRDVFRFPFRLVFTSASQRNHTRWTRFLIKRMDGLVATSEATAAYLHHPATVIAHGIDLESFWPAIDKTVERQQLGLPDLRLIGCFGRLRFGKGADIFVDAVLPILAARPDVGAILVGRVTSRHVAFTELLRTKIRLAGLQKRLLILPEVPTEEMPHWYRGLDVYVAPQRWEGFGVTPLEAMASGVPVVATRVGAFPQLLTKETGILVDAADVVEMTDAILAVLDNAERAAAMGSAGRHRVVKEFSIDKEAKQLNDLYRGLLGRDRDRR